MFKRKKKIFLIVSLFKIDIKTLVPDPIPNWAKILDPDPNSMCFDPQHWGKGGGILDARENYVIPVAWPTTAPSWKNGLQDSKNIAISKEGKRTKNYFIQNVHR